MQTTRSGWRRRSLWAALLLASIGATLGLREATPSAAGRGGAHWRQAGAGFFVGNFSPGGTANGVLRYTGFGRPIDRMVAEGDAGLTIGCCMAFGPDEHLYVSSLLTGSVMRFHGITGAFIDEFIPAGSGGLLVPLVLVFHSDGMLYVGDLGTRAIRRFDAETGAPIDEFVPAGSQGMGLGDPQVFAFGPDGQLYVASQATHRVLRYDGTTGAFIDEFVPAAAGLVAPSGLVFGPDGHLYVGSTANNEVRRYKVGLGPVSPAADVFVTSGSGGLVIPVGLAFAPDGNLYVASAGSGDILRYSGRTGSFRGAFIPAGRGGISGPRVIAFKLTTVVCHQPAGRLHPGRTRTVPYLLAPVHLAHGDRLGRCEV